MKDRNKKILIGTGIASSLIAPIIPKGSGVRNVLSFIPGINRFIGIEICKNDGFLTTKIGTQTWIKHPNERKWERVSHDVYNDSFIAPDTSEDLIRTFGIVDENPLEQDPINAGRGPNKKPIFSPSHTDDVISYRISGVDRRFNRRDDIVDY